MTVREFLSATAPTNRASEVAETLQVLADSVRAQADKEGA
ncbi:gp54 [Mycobacterium phage Brujita]|uniref:Uncharacterized protein n=2 Tax=Brujitavirus brujita TaxID=561996 RepID=B5U3C2_9CAUD|nr:gp54 [Mycobacterium phage Brujita]ACI06268.1 hypothetical protein BRUJITA_54 [Mycobacterium phage Brujita]ADL71236.1 hypothetical protein ISLAND3_54 [Mycobacterium phage Island3]